MLNFFRIRLFSQPIKARVTRIWGAAMVRSPLIAATLFILAGTPASAADMALKAPPPPAATRWTGCYVGGELGWGWDNSAHSFSNLAPGGTSNPNGVVGGGLLGCNYQINPIVVIGLEGDIEGANLNGGYVNQTGGTSSGSANLTADGSVRGRLGAVVLDRSLLYVTAGWAGAHYNFMGGPAFGFGVPVPCCGFSTTIGGWTVGAGWEYAFRPNWTARIEYRHYDYGSPSGPLVPRFPAVIMSVRDTVDVVQLGVTYKFTSLFGR
ncbi:MAG: porin family protein [Hyphomicrobiales bacterium]|nr:porin family protein [Hyphomicrobiales bacterium]